jgi:hypothetical protein
MLEKGKIHVKAGAYNKVVCLLYQVKNNYAKDW